MEIIAAADENVPLRVLTKSRTDFVKNLTIFFRIQVEQTLLKF